MSSVVSPHSKNSCVKLFEGTMQWLIDVPAGGGESSPVTIDWEVTVAHSADLETSDFIE